MIYASASASHGSGWNEPAIGAELLDDTYI